MTNLKTLADIGADAHFINRRNGWDVFKKIDWPESGGSNFLKLCTHMALVHSEVSEATEAVRLGDRANFAEELADVVIRVASLSWGLGINLEAEILKKLERNAQRGLRHGGKLV